MKGAAAVSGSDQLRQLTQEHLHTVQCAGDAAFFASAVQLGGRRAGEAAMQTHMKLACTGVCPRALRGGAPRRTAAHALQAVAHVSARLLLSAALPNNAVSAFLRAWWGWGGGERAGALSTEALPAAHGGAAPALHGKAITA